MKRSIITDNMPRAVVLLSGGIDSATALAETSQTHACTALLVEYGQRNAAREMTCARMVAGQFRAEVLAVTMMWPATSGAPLSQRGGDRVSRHYVPGRNGVLVALGLSVAEALGADRVVIGATAEDVSGFPDCRPAYFDAWRSLATLGMARAPSIVTPLAAATKSDVIRRAVAAGVSLANTWSCYGEGPSPCRTCGACLTRARGFAEASVNDPLESIT